jgi:hypothetical protein
MMVWAGAATAAVATSRLAKSFPVRVNFIEHMIARCATVITSTQDFGKLFQRKAELQSSLCKLNSLDGKCRENPVTAARALGW